MQEPVRFRSEAGHELAGVLHRPDAGSPRAYAVFAHCFTCTEDLEAAAYIADALCQEGIAALRFDLTRLGPSEGEFAETHFSSTVQDLVDAAGFLASEYAAPTLLIGHSLGGTATLAAAHRIGSARAVATIAAPADPNIVLKDLRKALLVMHSPVDTVVSVDEAARIYGAALHPKSYISLDDADHLLSRPQDSHYAGHVLAAWASRFIGDPEDAVAPAIHHTGHVVVSGRPDDGFRVAINADGHRLLGDEPEAHGGSDRGASPYDLLSAALASCTVMTLNMYARHKRLPLESVRVDVRHGKIHAEDCGHCDEKSARIDRFERTIHLEGDLSEDQRKRLLEIADRCPVHRTLHSKIDIRSRLVA